jgi:hypothetical protein
VDVIGAVAAPSGKAGAQPKRRAGPHHHVGFRQADIAVEVADRRSGGAGQVDEAGPERGNGHQCDGQARHTLFERRGRAPRGDAVADDRNRADARVAHAAAPIVDR